MSLNEYSNADWANNLDDKKSVNGNCVFLRGNLISWSYKKQKIVDHSNTEAEHRALSTAAIDLVWVQNILTEIGIPLQVSPPTLWNDNQGARALANNFICHAWTKHIEIDVHYVRDLIVSNKLDIRYILTGLQPTNMLSEALHKTRFHHLLSKLTVEDSMCSFREAIVESYETMYIKGHIINKVGDFSFLLNSRNYYVFFVHSTQWNSNLSLP